MWSTISSRLVALTAIAGAAQAAEERIEAFERCMGTQFRVTVLASDIRGAQQAIARAFRRAAELDARFSDYRPDSELNQLCRLRDMRVSEDLRRILAESLRLHRETRGAFDIASGQLVRRWREARRSRILPPPARIDGKVELKGNHARLTRPGMQLDLGGIAKGFAAQEMLTVLKTAGFPRALVAAAGDLAVGEGPWRIELGATGNVELLENCYVSTSGDTEQFVEIGGVRYSHIVDPRTGLGLVHSRPVTVISAASGAEADALATALQVRPELRKRIRRKGIRVLTD